MCSDQHFQDGALAEFAALRQEIERRSTMQHNLFALQLTASAVIFSFALSRTGESAFLLIIPVSTFMLSARYVDQMYGIQNAGWYIRDRLSERVSGGLGWEAWLQDKERDDEKQRRKHAQFSQFRRRAALVVTFPAIAFGALAWSSPHAFNVEGLSLSQHLALMVFWVVGLVAAFITTQMIWRALIWVNPSGESTVTEQTADMAAENEPQNGALPDSGTRPETS